MTQEEKQFKYLDRLYTNIEGYKSLRFKVPVAINGVLLATSGYIIGSEGVLDDLRTKIGVMLILAFIGALGLLIYYFVKRQYDDIAEDIHYLWNKLGMTGPDFMDEGKQVKDNKLHVAPGIFRIGKVSMIVFALAGILMIWFS